MIEPYAATQLARVSRTLSAEATEARYLAAMFDLLSSMNRRLTDHLATATERITR